MATKKGTIESMKGGKHDVLLSPRITEKAARLAEMNAYTFNVRKDATKTDIEKAVKLLYGKNPVKIAVVNSKQKAMMRRGIPGKKASYAKATIYLKKGETIDFI